MRPAPVVEEFVKGDWAYVRTQGSGSIGHGTFVVAVVSGARKWIVLEYAAYNVSRDTLQFSGMVFGGNMAKEKAGTLDPSLPLVADSLWKSYLAQHNLHHAKRP